MENCYKSENNILRSSLKSFFDYYNVSSILKSEIIILNLISVRESNSR